MSEFACDFCGACCRVLIIEANWIDAAREPRLLSCVSGHAIQLSDLEDGSRCVVLYDPNTHCCPFLGDDNRCGIYPTRPIDCVAVVPGDAKCQQSRIMSDLPLLRDINGQLPSADYLRDSCDDYGLDFDEILVDAARAAGGGECVTR